MRVVFAPDSFKGSLDAVSVAEALAEGWREARPNDDLVVCPMADGGEGTLDALAAAVVGSRRMPVRVTGPDGEPVSAEWLLIQNAQGRTAVVELAATSGLGLLTHLLPMFAHTAGFGEAIRDALSNSIDRLLLGLGGSASSEGGAGALAALGVRLTDERGVPIALGAQALATLDEIDWSGAADLPAGGAIALLDVDNPLLGQRGAVAVFGAQKGVTGTLAPLAEAALARFADRATPNPGGVDAHAPGAGAAGGAGFGMLAWGARAAAGAKMIADTIGLPDLIASADFVVTGEGHFDAQSAGGKVPSEVARLAHHYGVDAGLVAGRISVSTAGFRSVCDLSELAGSPQASMSATAQWLRAAGSRLAGLG